jgi:hypothetical protein
MKQPGEQQAFGIEIFRLFYVYFDFTLEIMNIRFLVGNIILP